MTMKRSILLIPFLCFTIGTWAQNTSQKCTTSELLKKRIAENPDIEKKRIQLETQIQQWIASDKKSKVQSIITIPIVVHVLYKNAAENISDAQIYSQLPVLNDDFRMLNSNFNSTPAPFQALAADCELEFCLAETDPSGNPTTGITRTNVPSNFNLEQDYYNSANGGVDAWDNTQYLNIWVGDLGSGGTLGFATQPGTASSNDGVVIDDNAFGTVGSAANNQPNHLGRTATHEVGHYFNLHHIWGENNGGCNDDDQVADTPNQETETSGCPTFPFTDNCTSSGDGIMFCNYMDYSDDQCMTMFTQGQKTRMLAAINTGRPGLLNTTNCSNNNVSLTSKSTISDFELAPNPSQDYVTLSNLKNSQTLVVRDVTAKIILKQDLNSSDIKLDISKWRKGMYTFRISMGNMIYDKLFIKN